MHARCHNYSIPWRCGIAVCAWLVLADVGPPRLFAQAVDTAENETEAEDEPAEADAPASEPELDSPVAELEQLLQSAVEIPLMQQEVTTVSSQQSTVGKSPAAVFVITQEMIHRSGVTSIPEALRMAPGIQVARVSGSQWAVTSRGFNASIGGLFATNNKLLVLIDGRTVFTPFFNGTFWDVQDTLLEDIDRIEVIRGPGATIWGANAVNGVINIITKRAADTQGTYVKTGGGTEERGFTSARVGGQSADVNYRMYGKWFERDSSFVGSREAPDDWRQGRGGFRADWTPSDDDLFTVQGDIYEGANGFLNTIPVPNVGDDEAVRGGNLLARWTRAYSDDNDVSLQAYYDVADRANYFGVLSQHYTTYDIDFRHHLPVGMWHNVIWGMGYRSVSDKVTSLSSGPAAVFELDPIKRTYDTASVFAQDEITLTDELFLTLGSKLQHNDFSGWEVQPTIRMLYSPEQTWATWAAVSRAVRTPSRIEHDGSIGTGGPPFLQYVPTFGSEDVIAYECGYRAQPEQWFSWDAALFFNQYEHLSSIRVTPPFSLPIFNANDNRGEGYGIEISTQTDITPYWHLMANYSYLQLQIHPGALSIDFLGANGTFIEGASPHNQVYLMSTQNLTENVDCDVVCRYVDNLPVISVPSYIEMDLRLAWRPRTDVELSVVGQNLLQDHHLEYPNTPIYEVQRGVYGMMTCTW
jgi:iron complex outermembrane recepter protein